jgi:hypothetical protein
MKKAIFLKLESQEEFCSREKGGNDYPLFDDAMRFSSDLSC